MSSKIFTTKKLIVLLFILPYISPARAQNSHASMAALSLVKQAVPSIIERYAPGTPAEVSPKYRPVVYFRQTKKMSAAYQGFAIELSLEDRPLLKEDALFRKFGNIVFDRTADGKFSYMIMTQFATKQAVEDFLNTVVKGRVANARVIEYSEGKRVN